MTIQETYSSRTADFDQIQKEVADHVDLAGPFLISPSEKYFEQPRKLMIVGQETHGWGYYQKGGIEGLLNMYSGFNLGERYYSSPFWNVTRKLEKVLGIEPYSCVWSNINRYDSHNKRPPGHIEKKITLIDDLLIKEIEILRPNVIVFFTGPRHDSRITKIFDGVEYEKMDDWGVNQLSRLKHPLLPEQTYRTYHPRYLRIKGFEGRFLNGFDNNK